MQAAGKKEVLNMSKIACYYSALNEDMFFAVKFRDEDYERGKAIALDGWNAWWDAKAKEDELWDYGYAERALELLDAANIVYAVVYPVTDEESATGVAKENDGWPLWFDPNTITDWYEPGDKIKEEE